MLILRRRLANDLEIPGDAECETDSGEKACTGLARAIENHETEGLTA